MTSRIRTTAVFLQQLELAGYDQALPAGEYEVETELVDPVVCIEMGNWTASVLVHIKLGTSHPGQSRTLTVPLTELAYVIAKDKLSGKALTSYLFEEMLADPMICLLMQVDGASEEHTCGLYADNAGGQFTGRQEPKFFVKADLDGKRHLFGGPSREGTGE